MHKIFKPFVTLALLTATPALACDSNLALRRIHGAIDKVEATFAKNHLLVPGACRKITNETPADREVRSCARSSKPSDRSLMKLNLAILMGTCKQRILESNERAKGRKVEYVPGSRGEVEYVPESNGSVELVPEGGAAEESYLLQADEE